MTQSDELLFQTCAVEHDSSGLALSLRRNGQTFVLAIDVGLSNSHARGTV